MDDSELCIWKVV